MELVQTWAISMWRKFLVAPKRCRRLFHAIVACFAFIENAATNHAFNESLRVFCVSYIENKTSDMIILIDGRHHCNPRHGKRSCGFFPQAITVIQSSLLFFPVNIRITMFIFQQCDAVENTTRLAEQMLYRAGQTSSMNCHSQKDSWVPSTKLCHLDKEDILMEHVLFNAFISYLIFLENYVRIVFL